MTHYQIPNNYRSVRNTWGGRYVQSPIAFNMGQQIVPRYPSMGYASLTHAGAGNGLGYYSVHGAYPDYGKSCSRFGRRLCGGLVEGSTTFDPQNPPNMRSAMGNQDSGSIYQMMLRGYDVTQTPPASMLPSNASKPGDASVYSDARAHAGMRATKQLKELTGEQQIQMLDSNATTTKAPGAVKLMGELYK